MNAKVRIDGIEINRVNCVNYLGVFFDDKFNFEYQMDTIIAKINKRIGLLRRLQSKMTSFSKILFMKSIILPIYDYCSSIYLMADETRLIQLQRCVNKAARTVLNAPRDSNVNDMMSKLKILTVRNRIKFNAIKMIHKIISRGTPLSLFTKFKIKSTVRERNLRNDNDYVLPNWNNIKFRKSMYYNILKMYNDCKNKYSNDDYFLFNCKRFIISLN